MDTQIIRQYNQDQLQVNGQDRSLLVLPLQVRLCRHTLCQKRLWVETRVDIACQAWRQYRTTAEETRTQACLAPLWQLPDGTSKPRIT